MVLFDAAIFHLVEAEDAFQYAESMFYFRSDPRLGRERAIYKLSCYGRKVTPFQQVQLPNATLVKMKQSQV
jgi:hypothetical protein